MILHLNVLPGTHGGLQLLAGNTRTIAHFSLPGLRATTRRGWPGKSRCKTKSIQDESPRAARRSRQRRTPKRLQRQSSAKISTTQRHTGKQRGAATLARRQCDSAAPAVDRANRKKLKHGRSTKGTPECPDQAPQLHCRTAGSKAEGPAGRGGAGRVGVGGLHPPPPPPLRGGEGGPMRRPRQTGRPQPSESPRGSVAAKQTATSGSTCTHTHIYTQTQALTKHGVPVCHRLR